MRTIDTVIVHCSDTPDTLDIGVKEIRQWHTAKPPLGNGWADIGYHMVVRRSGKLETGRKEEVVGAHVEGHNAHSLGICWVGRNAMAAAQYNSLVGQILSWLKLYKLTPDNVKGHCEFNSGKTCPNINMVSFRAQLWIEYTKEQSGVKA